MTFVNLTFKVCDPREREKALFWPTEQKRFPMPVLMESRTRNDAQATREQSSPQLQVHPLTWQVIDNIKRTTQEHKHNEFHFFSCCFLCFDLFKHR